MYFEKTSWIGHRHRIRTILSIRSHALQFKNRIFDFTRSKPVRLGHRPNSPADRLKRGVLTPAWRQDSINSWPRNGPRCAISYFKAGIVVQTVDARLLSFRHVIVCISALKQDQTKFYTYVASIIRHTRARARALLLILLWHTHDVYAIDCATDGGGGGFTTFRLGTVFLSTGKFFFSSSGLVDGLYYFLCECTYILYILYIYIHVCMYVHYVPVYIDEFSLGSSPLCIRYTYVIVNHRSYCAAPQCDAREDDRAAGPYHLP